MTDESNYRPICHDCLAYDDNGNGMGACRLSHPIMTDGGHCAQWPIVGNSDWCLEHTKFTTKMTAGHEASGQ